MKSWFTIFAITLLSTFTTYLGAQNLPANGVDTIVVSRISSIKQKFTAINANLKLYKKIDQDVYGESTEGGAIIKYYDGKAVVKMVVEFYGETGKSVEEYYYDNSRLMFYYSSISKYDKPMYIKGSKTKSIKEARYYFLGNRIISYLCKPVVKLSDKRLNKLSMETLKESSKRLQSKG